jgi:nicotinate-nucleotide adenylyltransferase
LPNLTPDFETVACARMTAHRDTTKNKANGARRIALFGGSFDPIHDGHVFIASEAQRQCRLDQVIFIPCWQSPHKPAREIAPSQHRLEMCRLATNGLPWAAVSDHELEQAQTSYSWKTARHFHDLWPDARLFWLLGVDQWRVIDAWERPNILAGLLTFIVFGRNGETPEPNPIFTSTFLRGRFDASATQVRQAVALNQTPQGTCPAVSAYILDHQLYSTPQGS